MLDYSRLLLFEVGRNECPKFRQCKVRLFYAKVESNPK